MRILAGRAMDETAAFLNPMSVMLISATLLDSVLISSDQTILMN